MAPKGQKFVRGDRVRIADDLGPSMVHFTKSANATVLHSYEEAHGHGERLEDGEEEEIWHEYAIDIDGQGWCAWYDQDQLTLISEETDYESQDEGGATGDQGSQG